MFLLHPVSMLLSVVVMVMVWMLLLPLLLLQGLNQLTQEQQEEVHRVCEIIPNIDVKVRKHSFLVLD